MEEQFERKDLFVSGTQSVWFDSVSKASSGIFFFNSSTVSIMGLSNVETVMPTFGLSDETMWFNHRSKTAWIAIATMCIMIRESKIENDRRECNQADKSLRFRITVTTGNKQQGSSTLANTAVVLQVQKSFGTHTKIIATELVSGKRHTCAIQSMSEEKNTQLSITKRQTRKMVKNTTTDPVL